MYGQVKVHKVLSPALKLKLIQCTPFTQRNDGREERFQIQLKATTIGPPVKRHLNGVLLADR